MNWHSLRFRFSLLVIFIVLIICVGAAIVYIRFVTSTRVIVPPLPTPTSVRTTYVNAQFGYSLHYPTQWYLQSSKDSSFVRVFMKHDLSVPDAVAFEIRCSANPNQLDAKTYWQQSQRLNAGEIGKGVTTFSSGASAYIATGQGQTPFTLYTLVHTQVACTILTPETDPSNAQVVVTTINSFRWQ